MCFFSLLLGYFTNSWLTAPVAGVTSPGTALRFMSDSAADGTTFLDFHLSILKTNYTYCEMASPGLLQIHNLVFKWGSTILNHRTTHKKREEFPSPSNKSEQKRLKFKFNITGRICWRLFGCAKHLCDDFGSDLVLYKLKVIDDDWLNDWSVYSWP